MKQTALARHLASTFSLALLLSAVVVAAVQPGRPGPLAAQEVTCPAAGHPDHATASAKARACGGRVLVSGATDETSQTFANADGTFTWESTVRTRFARTERGDWVTADPTLTFAADGSVRPVAAAFTMVLSGGGPGRPLISASRKGRTLGLSWKGALPKPTLSGNVATYADVLPGVDLRVVAEVDGFAEHIVVKTRTAAVQAALRRLNFGLSTDGLTVKRTGSGGLSAVDSSGDEIFSAGTPRMWDSSDKPARARLMAEGDVAAAEEVMPRSETVGLALASGELSLTPDAQMLADESLVYPVVIDPVFTGAKNHWIALSQSEPNVSYWDVTDGTFSSTDSTNGLIRVGMSDWQAPIMVMRPVFEMDTSGVANAGKVTAASFILPQRWNGVKCTDGPTDVGLYWTGPINSSLNWNSAWNAGAWTNRVGLNNEAHRADTTGTCGPADVTFDLTPYIDTMTLGCCSALTFGMKGENEGSHNSWKRYLNNATGSPRISLTFNLKPQISSASTVPATSCVTGSGRPVISSVTPTLQAAVSDADTSPVSATFEWWTVNGSSALGTATVSVASGGTASQTVPNGQISSGNSYKWRVTVTDGLTPVTSAWCEFTTAIVDPPAAGCPATLTDGDFNGDGVRDRVIGDPRTSVGSLIGAGVIHVIDGATGAVTTLQQGSTGVTDTPEAADHFGRVVVPFDANRDGCADLAVGVPFEDLQNPSTIGDAGIVQLIYGSPQGLGRGPAGLTIAQGAVLPYGRGTVPDVPESSDYFGNSVAAGVTAAGESYLVIGAPGEDLSAGYDAGTVHYLRGAVNVKLDGRNPQGGEQDDKAGFAVAGSPYQFAFGVPGEKAAAAGTDQAGAVCVLNHNTGATAPSDIRCIVQGDDANPAEAAERGDHFGKSLSMIPYRPVGAAAGLANSLLAVGVPGEDVAGVADVGLVQQFLVTTTGASQRAAHHQASPGIGATPDPGDYWGDSVVLTNQNPAAEASAATVLIAVGQPGADVAGVVDAGSIRVFAAGVSSVSTIVAVNRSGGALPGTAGTQELIGEWMAAAGPHLLVAAPYGNQAVYAIPWSSLASGSGTPAATYAPGQGGLPSGAFSFGLSVG